MKEISLTQNKTALVDDEDYDYLIQFKWQSALYRNTWYAKRDQWFGDIKKYKRIFMHKLLLPEAKIVDHKNGNGLDNQKSNLRTSTVSQNGMNSKINSNSTSGYKGVNFVISHNRWRARIKLGQQEWHLGEHSTALEAAQAYNIAAEILFGEFAKSNEVPQPSEEFIEKIKNKLVLKQSATPSNSTTGYRGVQYVEKGNKYMAKIFIKPKQVLIGYYGTAIGAAKAYNEKAIEVFGDKARLNNLEGE